MTTSSPHAYDVLGVAAHPDDLEVVMGGTAAKLVADGLRMLFVDLSPGEPTRHAVPGARGAQAARAAQLLGVDRVVLHFQDRFITDSLEVQLAVARLIRQHRPRLVFTTEGYGVHPDHKASTDITVNAIFYARLPKWDEVPGAEALAATEPHEIERLFFGHCRMEAPWERFDFAVDVSEFYEQQLAALAPMRRSSLAIRRSCSIATAPRTATWGVWWVCGTRRRSRRGVRSSSRIRRSLTALGSDSRGDRMPDRYGRVHRLSS